METDIDTGLRDWFATALATSGKTNRATAEAIGIDPGGISRILGGRRRLQAEEIPVIVEFLGAPLPEILTAPPQNQPTIPVLCDLACEIWRDVHAATKPQGRLPMPYLMDPRFAGLPRFAHTISDTSVNRRYPRGSQVSCVDYWRVRNRLHDGDAVVVDRYLLPSPDVPLDGHADESRIESTVKILYRVGRDWELRPYSTEPRWKRIKLSKNRNGDLCQKDRPDILVKIRGLIVGFYIEESIG